MKRNLKLATVAAGIAATLMLTACGSGDGGGTTPPDKADGPVTLKIGTSTEVVQWAPSNSVSITDLWVTGQHFPTLFQLDAASIPQPNIGESFDVVEDGKVLNIKLKGTHKWSDGEAITAEDVKFTLDRYKTDKLRGGSSYIFNYDKAEVVSPTEVNLHMINASYGWALDVVRGLAILPKHVFEDIPNLAEFNLSEHPDKWISGGSFVMTNIVPGQRYEFEPNEEYTDRAPGNENITKVEFQVYGDMNTMQLALRNGDIDMIAPTIPSSSLASLAGNTGVEINELKEALNYTKLTFNVSRDNELADPVVRQVISGLIDTGALLDTVLQGHGTKVVGPMLPVYPEYQPDIKEWKYTAEEAKTILAGKGYSNLSFNLGCDQGNANHAKYAQIIRDQLTPAGINVDLQCAERTVSIDTAKKGGYDLYIHKLNQAGAPGGNLVLQYDPSNPAGLQYNFFTEEAKLSALLAATNTATTEAEYIETVKAAGKYIHDEAYVLPLYVESLNIAFRGDRFQGFEPTGMETSTMVNEHSLSQVVPQ